MKVGTSWKTMYQFWLWLRWFTGLMSHIVNLYNHIQRLTVSEYFLERMRIFQIMNANFFFVSPSVYSFLLCFIKSYKENLGHTCQALIGSLISRGAKFITFHILLPTKHSNRAAKSPLLVYNRAAFLPIPKTCSTLWPSFAPEILQQSCFC